MADTGRRQRLVREYVEGSEPPPPQPQSQTDTGRFPVVERPAFYAVERPMCNEHSGICQNIVGLRDRLTAIERDLKEARGSWRVALASALAGMGVAVLTWLLTRAAGG